MNSEMNEAMKRAQQGVVRLHKIDAMLKQLEIERERLRGRECELKLVMDKEKGDVEKLENKSIASLFYSMLGSLEERAEKERKEALSARLKYDQILKDLEDVHYQISNLTSERLNYVNCQEEYNRLYVQKKEELLQQKGETAEKILVLTDNLNHFTINLKEIREAISIGREVIDSLDRALDSLDRAEGWGTWDLLGGGLISDLAKHSHMDDAKFETENTQRLLRQFKTELTDISIDSNITMETEGFARFADFFFDGLIADWFMQSRIHESQESVSEVKSQVSNIIEKLCSLENEEKSKIMRCESEMDGLVMNETVSLL